MRQDKSKVTFDFSSDWDGAYHPWPYVPRNRTQRDFDNRGNSLGLSPSKRLSDWLVSSLVPRLFNKRSFVDGAGGTPVETRALSPQPTVLPFPKETHSFCHIRSPRQQRKRFSVVWVPTHWHPLFLHAHTHIHTGQHPTTNTYIQIGRASCRERV